MKRMLVLIAGTYLGATLVGRMLEAAGVNRCGCASDCWCKRPGPSLFRWVFRRGHRGISAEHKQRLDR
jgi:hypothetical protein